ncbi:hematopoietic prostaglandin D synthase-like, partial [Mizuhopecten yessoensis]|uniref:hematopoietic prostaglandin D synthase-like n=1 Tax=Mizuhopecten yessoensis TaxID=6573 RepID=UPI000B45A3AB
LPLGQIPILEVDGTIIAQSGAMARHVAREHDLYGKGNMEMTMVDVVLETLNDFSKERMKSLFEKDEEEKQKLTKVFDGETVPRFLAVFEKMLGENDWMVGSKLSLADLAVFNAFEAIAKTVMEESGNDIYAGYPKLKVHADRVKSVEHVKIWLDTRPKTKF